MKHKAAVALKHKAPLFSVIKGKCCFGFGCFEKNSSQENLIVDKYSWGSLAHSTAMTANKPEGRKNLTVTHLLCTCGRACLLKPMTTARMPLPLKHRTSSQTVNLSPWGPPRTYPILLIDPVPWGRRRKSQPISSSTHLWKALKEKNWAFSSPQNKELNATSYSFLDPPCKAGTSSTSQSWLAHLSRWNLEARGVRITRGCFSNTHLPIRPCPAAPLRNNCYVCYTHGC